MTCLLTRVRLGLEHTTEASVPYGPWVEAGAAGLPLARCFPNVSNSRCELFHPSTSLLIESCRFGKRYRVDATSVNERLLAKSSPGWSANELLHELLTRTVRIVAFDFPFSIPDALLRDEKFAVTAGSSTARSSAGGRSTRSSPRLQRGEPLDFRPFDAWRSRSDRARLWTRRATDIVAGGQPPLKDKFQGFQMTLLGNAVL